MPPFRPFLLHEIKPKGWFLAQIRRDLEEGFASRLDSIKFYVHLCTCHLFDGVTRFLLL